MNETEPLEVAENKPKSKISLFFMEVLKFFLIIVFVILPFRMFVAQPFIVEGASMDPNFANGQYLIVDQLSHRFEDPARNSVLIFKYPRDHKQFFIKRIIGLPGETVKMTDGEIRIFNTDFPEGFMLDQSYLKNTTRDTLTKILGDDEFFVLGDNRPVSSDSRIWGTVSREEIIGRPFLRLVPLSKIGILPGDFSE